MHRVEIGPGHGPARPKLVFPSVAEPKAIVLMLHGGDVEGVEPVGRWDVAAFAVRVMADNLQEQQPDLGFARLINAVSGWNERIMSPVADAEWALMRLRQVYPGLPVAVVGHSMGGRAVFELVRSHDFGAVVGLAPWLADGYDERRFRGTPLMIVHGRADTETSADASADLVRRVRADGGTAIYLSVLGWHSLLLRPSRWQRQVGAFLQRYLVDRPAIQPWS
ncbi:hypothetical protein IEE94_13090 [Yimella sp. cx-573]|nr:hypothetical protein [Yimella sp. cx-573]